MAVLRDRGARVRDRKQEQRGEQDGHQARMLPSGCAFSARGAAKRGHSPDKEGPPVHHLIS
jgi:hypothetical protein